MIGAVLAGGGLGWPAVRVVLRALWYTGGLFGSGLAFFALLHAGRQDTADRTRLRRWAALAAGVALVAGFGWLVMQVMVLTDGGSVLDAEAWSIVAESRSGPAFAVGAAGLLLVMLLAAPAGTLLPALGGALFAGSHALLGHTTMLPFEPLPAALVAVHVAVAAWWIGSLFPLAWAARRAGPAAAPLVESWAWAAAIAVPVMAAAGLWLSAWLLGGFAPFLQRPTA